MYMCDWLNVLISVLFIYTCLHVRGCLCGKFMNGTTMPPYVHINNRVQWEETFVIKSCCVLKYVGSWAEQEMLRFLTAARQEVQLCWARQTSSKLHSHARSHLCVCARVQKQICFLLSMLALRELCIWNETNRDRSANVSFWVCVCGIVMVSF